MELTITFIILLITIFLFISGVIRADLVAILSLIALMVSGVLSPQEGLAGFSNSTVIMLAGLFVVGGGILRTGLASQAGQLILKSSNNNEARLFILLMVVVAIVGSFISNTGTLAIMLPIVISITMSMKMNASKFLIPLAFAASLSGFMTLISTPTNLIVSQILGDNGFQRLSFFSITPLGMIAFITGLVYLFLVRNHLLPKNNNNRVNNNKPTSPHDLIRQYRLSDNLHRLIVSSESPLINKTLGELKIPATYHLIVLKIERKANETLPLIQTSTSEMAGPKSIIRANDILYVEGSSADVARFAIDYRLEVEKHNDHESFVSKEIGVAEVLLTPNSSYIGKKVTETSFRKKYNLNIIGVNQKGTYNLDNLSQIRLRFGDALLVQGAWDEIEFLSKDTSEVVVVGQPKEYAKMATANGKAPIAAGILIVMVLLMIFEVFPTVVCVLIAAVLMILTGCLRNTEDAYSQINWESIVLIGAMLPMGTALEKTGGISLISNTMIDFLGGFGPIGILAGIYLLTNLFGQFVSNTATAVLFAPIAINASIELGVSPYPFIMAVATAAGMSFATPFSSPTNALVMTAGNYKFIDFFKVGFPLIFIMFIVMMIAIPIIYPF